MRGATADQLDRIEAKLDQVLELLTDEGAEDEQADQRVVVSTMDGRRHEVTGSHGIGLSRTRET